ncbi:hypothetical protein STCU_07723 [Strigomonas culicis]|uniref:Uncharacterized protein n=1 Tax=Strigomonas culicis TaxID=28005 RepID=S9U3A3_9TRYP|nr:hypothetical protein STCU_07723 [Strigomonas culicis]|eukprot:EPY23413.1 hypothetical protein STCU_07723 [Strigomonas culicis]
MPLSHHLKKFVTSDTAHLAKSKTAKDVIPSLRPNGSTSATAAAAPAFELHEEVLQYLRERQQRGAASGVAIPAKLSSRQRRILQSLLQQTPQEGAGEELCKVRRAVLERAPHAITHLLALVSLQLRQLGLAAADTTAAAPNSRILFVLVEGEAEAAEMQRVWEQLYGMQVLRLDGQEKFPQFTPTDATPEPTKETPAKQSKKKKKKVETTTPASPLSGTSIIVATLHGFLATDKRSAIWKHVYAFVTALLPSSDAPAPEEAYALLAALRQDAPQDRRQRHVRAPDAPPLGLPRALPARAGAGARSSAADGRPGGHRAAPSPAAAVH